MPTTIVTTIGKRILARLLTVRPARSVMFMRRSSLVVSARTTGGWMTGTIDM